MLCGIGRPTLAKSAIQATAFTVGAEMRLCASEMEIILTLRVWAPAAQRQRNFADKFLHSLWRYQKMRQLLA